MIPGGPICLIKSHKKPQRCFFCEKIKNQYPLFVTKHFLAFLDQYPVNPCHIHIISKKHCKDFFDLDKNEWKNLQLTIHKAKKWVEEKRRDDHEPIPKGYNLGINCGKVAGQTIFHFHLHVIPRYRGDVKNPRGGVRNLKEALVPYA